MNGDGCGDGGGHGGCDHGNHALSGSGDATAIGGSERTSFRGIKQIMINGAPVTEQSHEYVIKVSKKNAPNQ